MYTDPAVHRSTMMGLPCVRLDGQFFASLDRRTHALLVKLPTAQVRKLIADGVGEPFAPAGRVFREVIGTTRFVPWCADHLTPFQPLLSWLTPHAGT